MPITPTSSISKNYQALGIDEIANDIETVFTSVNALETTVNALPAAPTTTVVNISSAQIKAMGATPIELLPAAGSGNYYEIEKIILEYTHVSTAYTFAGILTIFGQYSTAVDSGLITASGNRFTVTKDNTYPSDAVGYNYAVVSTLNNNLTLSTDDGSDPTLGNGTLRAIITYTTRTFGA